MNSQVIQLSHEVTGRRHEVTRSLQQSTRNIKYLLIIVIVHIALGGSGQFLSNLQAVKSDALYTTYAAPLARSQYKNDQGYRLQWADDASGVEFVTKDGPNMGIAFNYNNCLIFKLQELYQEPIVTTSYSDLVKYYYYPVKDLRVEVFFVVYSSSRAILQYRMVNEGLFPLTFSILPYICFSSNDSLLTIEHQSNSESYTFSLIKKPDGWMVDHDIPVADTLTGLWTLTGCGTLTGWTFVRPTDCDKNSIGKEPYGKILASMILQKRNAHYVQGGIQRRDFTMAPGDVTSFRVDVNTTETKFLNQKTSRPLHINGASGITAADENRMLKNPDPGSLVKEDEKAYSNIPKLAFTDKDKELLYWSTYSLMRQCMLPPEGECKHNYYVFSREPKWGWGYGGQVFHESLVMMAYAFMDPAGAINSQRVYMDRQRPDGYINYRTGPYLNETIETNGKYTSSAPWFNYVNLEIYKITGDRVFLKEAYASGKRFYQYYVANRDSNNNGLCEWGAHAELESVRDARVAVWDKVGWAANFEGPDVNSMLVMEAKSLGAMADQLGLKKESAKWQDDANSRGLLINKHMWDSVTSFYYNVNRRNQTFGFHSPDDLKIKEIIGFLPLWAGIADSITAHRLVEKMQDTLEFWRNYGIPSLSAADDYYCPIGYWNGPVWVQWNYLLYRGLQDYGYSSVADQLANRVLDNMIFHLKKDHIFYEFYSADDHQAGWNQTYIWAGIAARFLIDSMKMPPISVKGKHHR